LYTNKKTKEIKDKGLHALGWEVMHMETDSCSPLWNLKQNQSIIIVAIVLVIIIIIIAIVPVIIIILRCASYQGHFQTHSIIN